MSLAHLIQTLASLVAILLLAGLAWWAKIARSSPPLDADTTRMLMAEEFPDQAIDQVWVAADGLSALARSGADALILYQAGDGYVARSLPWSELSKAKAGGGVMALALSDITAPRVRFALGEGAVWPPLGGET